MATMCRFDHRLFKNDGEPTRFLEPAMRGAFLAHLAAGPLEEIPDAEDVSPRWQIVCIKVGTRRTQDAECIAPLPITDLVAASVPPELAKDSVFRSRDPLNAALPGPSAMAACAVARVPPQ